MVVFNALQTTLSGGIGRYSYELSKAIYLTNKVDLKIVIRKEDIELFNFASEKDLIIVDGINSGKQRNYKEQLVVPQIINEKFKDAIIHYPDSMAPLFSRNKVVITIHDLAFLTRKEDLTKSKSTWKKLVTSKSVKKADRIICITNFAKSEVEKYYPMNKHKVDVVYNGFNDFSKENIVLENVRDEIREYTKQPYILNVSTISPRKNMDGLIKAFDAIKNKVEYNLIIAGGNGWLYESIYKLADELKLRNRVIFTGKINDDELKCLYKNASVFVYPSYYEGFGLPPLEAMSYGIPTIVSNMTSIPEVVGDAGLYVDPYNPKDISDKIVMISDDTNLKSNLISLGNKKIKEYNWEKCAEETIKVYNKLL